MRAAPNATTAPRGTTSSAGCALGPGLGVDWTVDRAAGRAVGRADDRAVGRADDGASCRTGCRREPRWRWRERTPRVRVPARRGRRRLPVVAGAAPTGTLTGEAPPAGPPSAGLASHRPSRHPPAPQGGQPEHVPLTQGQVVLVGEIAGQILGVGVGQRPGEERASLLDGRPGQRRPTGPGPVTGFPAVRRVAVGPAPPPERWGSQTSDQRAGARPAATNHWPAGRARWTTRTGRPGSPGSAGRCDPRR